MGAVRKITMINVPSDVGSMIKGKHLAPNAFKSVKFAEKLQNIGYQIDERDALSKPQIWSSESTFGENGARNEEANVKVHHEVKKAVGEAINSAAPPPFILVVGGECSIVPAILSSFWSSLAPKRIGLMYVDGDADLATPNEAGSSGNLASMTFTHLVLREGALKSQLP